MLIDGCYIAWFKTKLGQGTGRVLLENGKISGGDTVITYSGSYQAEGTQFTAVLKTSRHAPGQPSVFGVDEVEIKLAGSAAGNFATCSGEVEQVPGMVFEVTLMPVKAEPDGAVGRPYNPADFHPERLPKGKIR